MKIMDYVNIIWRRKWIIAITAIVVTGVVFVGSRTIRPSYQATATIRVTTTIVGSDSYVQYDVRFADRLMATYVEIATSRPVLRVLADRLGVENAPSMNVRVIPNTELMEVRATAGDPRLAQRAANELADYLISDTVRMVVENANTLQVENAILVEEAVRPQFPSGVNTRMLLVMGGLAGLVGGLVLAILFETLDTRLYRTAAIETTTQLPMLGAIPDGRKPLIGPAIPLNDAFIRLGVRLFPVGRDRRWKSLVIASPASGEGKSTIVAELAVVLSEMGQKVAVVDADLRRPSLHNIYGLDNQRGLVNVLRGGQLADVMQTIQPGRLSFLPGGTGDGSTTRLLSGTDLKQIIDQLKAEYDVVLIDVPALGAVSDGLLVSTAADAVLLIVERGHTTREAALAAIQQLRGVGANLIGMVINRAERNLNQSYAEYIAAMPTTVSVVQPQASSGD